MLEDVVILGGDPPRQLGLDGWMYTNQQFNFKQFEFSIVVVKRSDQTAYRISMTSDDMGARALFSTIRPGDVATFTGLEKMMKPGPGAQCFPNTARFTRFSTVQRLLRGLPFVSDCFADLVLVLKTNGMKKRPATINLDDLVALMDETEKSGEKAKILGNCMVRLEFLGIHELRMKCYVSHPALFPGIVDRERTRGKVLPC